MTVVTHDAVDNIGAKARSAYKQGEHAGLNYADYVFLLCTSDRHLKECFRAVAVADSRLGLELPWGKFQHLVVNSAPRLYTPTGGLTVSQPPMQHFRATLPADGRLAGDLCGRIGMAKADFAAVSRIWRHSPLPRHRKLNMYATMLESKLLYSLRSACLAVAHSRRL